MKFKFKLAAAAVALAAVAGQASALTGTDAILYFIDSANSSSFVQDLGASLPATTVQLSGADWASFSTQASYAADLAAGNILWGVVLAPSSAAFTTSYATGSALGLPAAAAFSNIVNNVGGIAATGIGAPSTYFAPAGSTNSPWNQFGLSLSANVPFSAVNVFNAAGSTASLETFTAAVGRNGNITQAAAGTFTVAAVPEPETYGMMAAGLLMLGAIARRRKV